MLTWLAHDLHSLLTNSCASQQGDGAARAGLAQLADSLADQIKEKLRLAIGIISSRSASSENLDSSMKSIEPIFSYMRYSGVMCFYSIDCSDQSWIWKQMIDLVRWFGASWLCTLEAFYRKLAIKAWYATQSDASEEDCARAFGRSNVEEGNRGVMQT